MRIACPNCSAEYDVPESLLAAGPRLLRCARCAHQFEAALPRAETPPTQHEAPAARPEAPHPAGPAPATPPDQPQAPPPAPPPDDLAPPDLAADNAAAPPPLEATAPLVDRPPPTRGPARHSPIDPRAATAPPPRAARRFAATVAVAWVASLAVIFAAGWATYTYHEEITAAWPPIARLYQALGIE